MADTAARDRGDRVPADVHHGAGWGARRPRWTATAAARERAVRRSPRRGSSAPTSRARSCSRQQAGAHDPALMLRPDRRRPDLLLAGGDRARRPADGHPGARGTTRRRPSGGWSPPGWSSASATPTPPARRSHGRGDAGARMVTHLFNAQRALRHREPGVPGQALADDRFTLGLIADLHHVDRTIVHLVFRGRAGTDRAGHRRGRRRRHAAGPLHLGGVEVVVEPGDRLPRRADGDIAGSVAAAGRGRAQRRRRRRRPRGRADGRDPGACRRPGPHRPGPARGGRGRGPGLVGRRLPAAPHVGRRGRGRRGEVGGVTRSG